MKRNGFTLIEVLIAMSIMTVGLLIYTGGFTQIYHLTTEKNRRVADLMQESTRLFEVELQLQEGNQYAVKRIDAG